MKTPISPWLFSSTLHVNVATGIFFFILALNSVAVVYQVRTIFPPSVNVAKRYSEYTWEGHDHPRTLDLDLGDKVALTIADYDYYGIDTPEGAAEWKTVFPPGKGFIHMGPKMRRFGLSMFHQYHCLDMIRTSIIEGTMTDHIHHCFNYLRQTIMCAADLTLEEGAPHLGPDSTGELAVDGLGMTHTCRDWSKVYAYLGEQNDVFKEWKKTHNLTVE